MDIAYVCIAIIITPIKVRVRTTNFSPVAAAAMSASSTPARSESSRPASVGGTSPHGAMLLYNTCR